MLSGHQNIQPGFSLLVTQVHLCHEVDPDNCSLVFSVGHVSVLLQLLAFMFDILTASLVVGKLHQMLNFGCMHVCTTVIIFRH